MAAMARPGPRVESEAKNPGLPRDWQELSHHLWPPRVYTAGKLKLGARARLQ